MHFVFHRGYSGAVTNVPHDPVRGERILAFLTGEGLLDERDIAVPRRPSLRTLLRVHDAEYLESLALPEAMPRIFGATMTDEDQENVIKGQRLMVGGTLYATRLALTRRGVAVNLGGGFHHAYRDRGEGFCIFNDVAVAIARIRDRGFSEPILIIDLDLHDGSGTRSIFALDPSVHTYSVHNQHWSDTEAVASTSIALGDGVSDEHYLGTLVKSLPDVVESVAPGLVFYVAGVDLVTGDPLGTWQVTADGLLSRDRYVMGLLRRRTRPIPVVVVLAGGYGDSAWRYSARFFSWLLAGHVIEPPANEEMTLMRYRRIWRKLDPLDLTSEPDDSSWKLTPEDLVGIIPGAPRQTRFLGYFSRHGLELVLERFGLFDQLRVRGFDNPCLDLDLDHPQGQTLRIFGDLDHDELLMELRVDRSQRAVPGMEVLVIEWLLLQNPRAAFGPYRRPLPGQIHPGLGLLKGVFGWLLVVCEMLELDGVYYVPSHYHVAAQSRRLVRFLEPEHEARFRRVRELVAKLPMAAATRLVAEGGIRDETTGAAFQWQGFPMVLPVSERLKSRILDEKEYEARVGEEMARLRLTLAER